jgi:hypothetical protein
MSNTGQFGSTIFTSINLTESSKHADSNLQRLERRFSKLEKTLGLSTQDNYHKAGLSIPRDIQIQSGDTIFGVSQLLHAQLWNM